VRSQSLESSSGCSRDIRDPAALFRSDIEENAPGSRLDQSQDREGGCRLAAPRLSDERDDLAPCNGEVDTIDGPNGKTAAQ